MVLAEAVVLLIQLGSKAISAYAAEVGTVGRGGVGGACWAAAGQRGHQRVRGRGGGAWRGGSRGSVLGCSISAC